MVINKSLDAKTGVAMIEKLLEQKKDSLPKGKTIKDFGGGYVECLKTKAKVVLYFGFDDSKNRVSINFQIKKEDILKWLNAIAEKVWNVEVHSDDIVSFDEDILKPDSTSKAFNGAKPTISHPNNVGLTRPRID